MTFVVYHLGYLQYHQYKVLLLEIIPLLIGFKPLVLGDLHISKSKLPVSLCLCELYLLMFTQT